jgi:hypothetical protein
MVNAAVSAAIKKVKWILQHCLKLQQIPRWIQKLLAKMFPAKRRANGKIWRAFGAAQVG